MLALQRLRFVKASLPPLLEDTATKVQKKRRDVEVETLVTCKRHHLKMKREKKVELQARAEPGRSISLSTDMKDMTSTVSGGMGPLASVGGPSHHGDVEASYSIPT